MKQQTYKIDYDELKTPMYSLLPKAEPTGVKHDQEKPRMELLSAIALQKTAEVMTFGAKKYAAHNWRGGLAWSRVLGALLRHTLAYLRGEDKDPETGLSHLAHASCCIMFLLEYEETHKELDDRYKPGKMESEADDAWKNGVDR